MTRITFLRHGNAEKVDGQPDIARKLSGKGRQQAQERRAKLGNPEFDLVLVSPAPRTAETAKIVAGSDSKAEFRVCHELFTPEGEDGRTLDALFDQLRYASLATYFSVDTTSALRRFAEAACRAIEREIRHSGAENILVVSHAVLLNAIGFELGRTGSDALSTKVLGECEGFADDGERITLIC